MAPNLYKIVIEYPLSCLNFSIHADNLLNTKASIPGAPALNKQKKTNDSHNSSSRIVSFAVDVTQRSKYRGNPCVTTPHPSKKKKEGLLRFPRALQIVRVHL